MMQIKWFFFILILLFSLPGSALTTTAQPPRDKDVFTVVLDAGHGGHDPGNLGNGYLEKDIALKIVLEAGKYLERERDVKVIYTRKDDSFVDLFVRGEIANKANADLFVSVHCDSHTSNAHGAGTFVLGLHANKQNFEIAKKENSVIYLEDNYETRYAEYDINSPESIIGLTIMQEEFLDQSVQLARLMQENFSNELRRKDRQVKQAGFIVLHQTFMPSVLVETGFLTNKNEGSYLNSRRGQSEMGRAIADAILTYKNNFNVALTPPSVIRDSSVETLPKDEPLVAEKPEAKKDTPLKKENPPVENPAPKKKKTEQPATQPITFKVQLLASSKNIPLEPKSFNGLKKLSKEPFQGLYRYFTGEVPSYEEAKRLRDRAAAKGYDAAFVVAYRGDQRLSLKEALAEQAQ